MTQTDITTASVVAYNDGILHDEVDREVVALSTVSGACYGLNAVGSRRVLVAKATWACRRPLRMALRRV